MLRKLFWLAIPAFIVSGTSYARGQAFSPAVPRQESVMFPLAGPSPRPTSKFRLFEGSTSLDPGASGTTSLGYDLRIPFGGLKECDKNALADFVAGCPGQDEQGKSQASGSAAAGGTAPPALKSAKRPGIRWGMVFLQSFEFIAIEHGLRMAFDPPSRRSMASAIEKGEFWDAYVRSLKTLHGWSDGNHFFVNYVGHAMQGAVTGFILVHNDPNGKGVQFGRQKAYWISRAKAMGWSTVYSIYWELGFPLSEAAIGNLGPDGRPGLGAVDLVITETVGTAYLVAEDILDLYVVRAVERKWCNAALSGLTRSILNLDRSFANLLRWKPPYYRDTRGGLHNCGK
jgi:hypothetical protein